MIKYYEFYQVQPRKYWKCQKFQDGLRYEILRVVDPLKLVEKCNKVESIDSLEIHSMGGPARITCFHRGGHVRNVGGRFPQGKEGTYIRSA